METLKKCGDCKYISSRMYEFPCVCCSPNGDRWEPQYTETFPGDEVAERIQYYTAKKAESEKKGMTLKVKLDEGAFMPERAHEWDAGADLRTPVDFTLYGGSYITINTGVHVEIPEGYVGIIKSKSGLMKHFGIVTDGTVDAGYTGEIAVCLFNHDKQMGSYGFRAGDKIAQLVILPIVTPGFVQVDEIKGGDRGDGGFGSTGR